MKCRNSVSDRKQASCRIIFNQIKPVYLLTLLFPLFIWGQKASGQDIKEVTLPEGSQIKVRLSRKLTSGRVRIGDYVPLTVAENILVASPFEEGRVVVALAKDTPLFGVVVDRTHRFSFFRSGKFGIALSSIKAGDGTDIPVYINRPEQQAKRGKKIERDDFGRAIIKCKHKVPNQTKAQRENSALIPCVKGRTYSGSLTGALPSAIAAAITTAALVLVKDNTAKTAAAVTLAGQVATQPGLSTILNGVDAEIDDGEIFDATIKQSTAVKVIKPK